jgi:nitrate reductase delta subunit
MDKRNFLHLLFLLLDYPNGEVYDFVKQNKLEITGIPEVDYHLEEFADFVRNKSLRELEEYYVENIDFSKGGNLYLTFHRFQDERKRGEVLAKIKEVYWNENLDIGSNELPDYLPLILEFAAVGNYEKGMEILEEYLPELEKIKKHFEEKENPYFHLLEALLNFLKFELVNK